MADSFTHPDIPFGSSRSVVRPGGALPPPTTAMIAAVAPALPPRPLDPPGPHAAVPSAAEPDPVVFGRSKIVEPPEPVALRQSAWAKQTYVAAAVLAGPVYFVASLAARFGDEPGSPAGVLSVASGSVVLVSVLLWSWVNVDNCRRVLDHSRFRDAISPWRAVFWWAAPFVVGIPLLLGVMAIDRTWIHADGATSSDADLAFGFLVAGWLLVMLVLWVRPYMYLGTVMKRIHGDPALFRKWFWMPIVATVIAAFGVTASAFAAMSDDGSGIAPQATAMIVFAMLPYIVWFWTGWRAMSIMDEFVHARSARQHQQRRQFLTTESAPPVLPEA